MFRQKQFFIKIDVICVRFDKILIEAVEIGGDIVKNKSLIEKKTQFEKVKPKRCAAFAW